MKMSTQESPRNGRGQRLRPVAGSCECQRGDERLDKRDTRATCGVALAHGLILTVGSIKKKSLFEVCLDVQGKGNRRSLAGLDDFPFSGKTEITSTSENITDVLVSYWRQL